MKNNTSQAILEFIMTYVTYGWAILVVLVMIAVLAYFEVLSPERFLPINSYFKLSPDKCVCEEFKTPEEIKPEDAKLGNEENLCKSFRKKTQAELDTDDCKRANWFVGDDKENKCECEKWINSSDNWHSRTPIEIFNEIYPFIGKYRDYTFEQCHFNIPPDSFNNYSQWLSTTNGLTCSEHNVCLKSRPKTDWELHPENYVAETECVKSKSFSPDSQCINEVDFNPDCCEKFKTTYTLF